jgi:hypothetical protein
MLNISISLDFISKSTPSLTSSKAFFHHIFKAEYFGGV